MKLTGLRCLAEFARQHADSRSVIAAWIAEVEDAQWETPQDVRARYASASFVGGNRIIFDLKGNAYRLDVKVSFKLKVVQVIRVGTHAEYGKWKF